MPSFACRVMDLIGAKIDGVDFGLLATRSMDGTPIGQNLTNPVVHVEIRVEVEENLREWMELLCLRVSIGWDSGLVISHTYAILSPAAAMSLPLGEMQQ
jgi:hypothetical protein